MSVIFDQFNTRESDEMFRKRVEINRPIAEQMANSLVNSMVKFLNKWSRNNPKKVLKSRAYKIIKKQSKK